MFLFKHVNLFLGNWFARRFNQPCINNSSLINSNAILMELFEKNTVDLNHGIFRETFSKARESRMIRRSTLHRKTKKNVKGNPVIEAKGKNPEQYPDWEYEEE